jgi:hypothetical protein
MSDPDVRRGREGSRWYNQRPTAEEVAEWFYTVRLAEGMLHPDYVSGITLISAREKSDEVFNFDSDGLPLIRERQDLVFIPYVKVDTRVAYFWNLIDHHAEQGWVGTIDPVTTPASETLGLPPGFFKYAATDPKGKAASFVGCSMRVKVVAGDGKLVVPGSGVATAEDMADNNVPAGAAAEPVLPATAVELTDDQLRDRATDLVAELSRLSRPKLEEYQEWARGRGLVLTQAQGPVLKSAVKKLEKTIAELEEAMAGV